jgi:transcriptional regulator with XRE-family HTH domain
MPKNIFRFNATLVVMNNLRDKAVLIKFGERLKELRTDKKLTLEQLAFAADIELSQVHRIEKGKINPTYTTLLALASGLEITISELLAD